MTQGNDGGALEYKTPQMCFHRVATPARMCAVCGDSEVLKLMDRVAELEGELEALQAAPVTDEMVERALDAYMHPPEFDWRKSFSRDTYVNSMRAALTSALTRGE